MNISTIIKDSAHTINVNYTIDKASELMNSFKQNGMPVVNDDKKLV